MELTIRNAKSNDIDTALDLLNKAALWLKYKNLDYWQNWLNPLDEHIAWIKQGFDKDEFYFVYNSQNIIVGMYRLQSSDEMFWGKRNDKAGYIHSFTTKREFKGYHIGYMILKTIEEELLKKNFDYLRLDCSPDIKGLCNYYEEYGFVPKETTVIHGEKLRLYEKKINWSLQK